MQIAEATERFADAVIFDGLVRPEQDSKFREELMLLEELADLLTHSPIGHPLD